jgi:hypothetical protein
VGERRDGRTRGAPGAGYGYSNQRRTGGALRWILHFVQNDNPISQKENADRL